MTMQIGLVGGACFESRPSVGMLQPLSCMRREARGKIGPPTPNGYDVKAQSRLNRPIIFNERGNLVAV